MLVSWRVNDERYLEVCFFFEDTLGSALLVTAITPLYWVVEELPLVLPMFVNISLDHIMVNLICFKMF